jgi:uncharacterized membrane protein YccC
LKIASDFRVSLQPNWSEFDPGTAIRCAAGVAIPLLLGTALHQPSVAAFGAVGAVSVGFGSFLGTERGSAIVMIAASFAMGAAMIAGALAGYNTIAAIVVATSAAFGGGFFVVFGVAASFIGLQFIVAVVIASGLPADVRDAVLAGALVLAGGLVQTMLVVLVWPARLFSNERRLVTLAYRSLAAYAAAMPAPQPIAPEPHTFAATGDVLAFRSLLYEAERLRASLALLATRYELLSGSHGACVRDLTRALARILAEIGAAVNDRRAPEDDGNWDALAACSRDLPPSDVLDALFGQLRAAWRTAGTLTNHAARTIPAGVRPVALPAAADVVTTIRANLSPGSAACRHAVRLAIAVGLAEAMYRVASLPRGYWMPMTAALVLKPDFADTFTRSFARVAGTLLGAAVATAVVHFWSPPPFALVVLILVLVWACYAVFRVNYALFTVFLTGYVVFLLMLSGVAEMTASSLRAEYTIGGGVLALAVFAAWPSWAGRSVRAALAEMLDAHRAYVDLLLGGFESGQSPAAERLTQLRNVARLARSNAEATIDRMAREPAHAATLDPHVAVDVLAALRRNALAALALHAGLERGVDAPLPGVAPLRALIDRRLAGLAAAIRAGQPAGEMPELRRAHLALRGAAAERLGPETDIMVDALNTIAALLTPKA